MSNAATPPDGVPLVANTGATSTFLPPRLGPGAGDLGHSLGGGVAGTLRSVVGDNCLVNRLLALVVVHWREACLQFALVRAAGVLDCYFHFLDSPPPLLGFFWLFLGLPNDNVVAVGTGDGALDQQQVVVGMHLNDL